MLREEGQVTAYTLTNEKAPGHCSRRKSLTSFLAAKSTTQATAVAAN